jgi:ATP-dependent Lon protease
LRKEHGVTSKATEEERLATIPEILPVLPLRNQVMYPRLSVPLSVGREKSVLAVEHTLQGDHFILMVAQRRIEVEDPGPDDLFAMGTVGLATHVLRMPDESLRLGVEGLARVRIVEWVRTSPFLEVKGEVLPEEVIQSPEAEAFARGTLAQLQRAAELGNRNITDEALARAKETDDPGALSDLIASMLTVKVEAKQEVLETLDPLRRLEKVAELLAHEIEVLEIERRIHSRVKHEVEDAQKEFILRERMKAIQQELGERDERMLELDELKQQIAAAQMPKEVEEKALKEVDRLEKMPAASPEVVVVRTYLDWLIAMPWSKRTEEKLDIKEAEKVLEQDHYALERVKTRILEYLAVRKLNPSMKGPILCFVGPPGTGKTSMGKSIARATGRNFVRISLGGVRDEGEIRGHRRTYVGALPGRIVQGMKNAASRNPVFMMDEVDKIGLDFRGDPAAALLEVLDPEQNNSFSDHYLEVPFDLSEVMFITTANFLDPVPPALNDRMEVIEFPGYIEEDKLKIAQLFLVPKQLKEHGLSKEQLSFREKGLRSVIRHYTWEAGVRNLEREIATICRKIAKDVAQDKPAVSRVTPASLHKFLGPIRFRYGLAEKHDQIGVATGLSATSVGGDTVSVEVALMKGRGSTILTGHLGDVMQESAKAAITYTRSRANALGLDEDFYRRTDIHIHVPAGMIPKDGPSAGITMAAALVSALTKRPVRKDVAMTGEVTLRGRVLPVGAIKEKVLAAHRAGMTTIIMPKDNEKDLEEIPAYVKRDLKFEFVEHMDEVLRAALRDGLPASEQPSEPDAPAQPNKQP